MILALLHCVCTGTGGVVEKVIIRYTHDTHKMIVKKKVYRIVSYVFPIMKWNEDDVRSS